MEEQILTVPEVTSVEVVDIQFRPGQKIYFFDPDGVHFETGDHVIIDTARGAEFGIVAGGNHMICFFWRDMAMLRVATRALLRLTKSCKSLISCCWRL